ASTCRNSACARSVSILPRAPMAAIPASESAKASKDIVMKRRVITTLAVLLALLPIVGPAAIAADLTGVGFLDQSAVATLPAFVAANQQVEQYKAQLQNQFANAMRGARSDADKQRITLQFQQEFSDKQNEVMGPLFQRA